VALPGRRILAGAAAVAFLGATSPACTQSCSFERALLGG